ncbi:hypothetical protein GALMADRAFT_243187 [Galerina marginata CBS 339.88]|uniref:Uncharacterized protein n=1 Tax=Galerina marginata (strain CBS 339.88) TaxID=685588 RepID=A0A067TJW0_GALM3|nr:hypothetical protein GALMADRAFT_243187 [Galerina marginata CBS 339.88]
MHRNQQGLSLRHGRLTVGTTTTSLLHIPTRWANVSLLFSFEITNRRSSFFPMAF